MKARRVGFGVVVSALLTLISGLVVATPASAATAVTFGPVRISGVPGSTSPPTQKVVELATISTPMTAGRTAYVYSNLRAYAANHANLIDNEVRCSGAGKSDVVLGENVLPSTGDPAHQDITITNRFLVSATTTGTLTCKLYLRTGSTAAGVVSAETVSGELRFASTSVGEDANGVAMQKSLPGGDIAVPVKEYTPIIDRTIAPGFTRLDVAADVEYHRCANSANCPANYSTARFTLFVTTSGGADCPPTKVAQVSETVRRGVNHAAIPLYAIVDLKPGCTEVYAYVRTEYMGGDVGSVGGAAVLPDASGPVGNTPNHTSAMTHMFAIPS